MFPITNNTTDDSLKVEETFKSTNWPLIIGLVVGAIGFLALSGFLIWYAIRVKKRQALKAKKEEFSKLKDIKSKPTKLQNESESEEDSEEESDDE